jgi:glucosamine-6-phosphate deaminase
VKIIIKENPSELGSASGSAAAQVIREAIAQRGTANLVLATGTSQFETMNQLTREDIDWGKVTLFHLDEYIGLPEFSPASFRKYLKERFIQKVAPLKAVFLIDGHADPSSECVRLERIISEVTIDLALVGIGENGHLGFNDPPADFSTRASFIVVDLDALCRNQQVGEGWFNDIREVPRQAITMSIHQIMKAKKIICSVPQRRKALAVKHCFENPVSPQHPAGILQIHPDCTCYLDRDAASLIRKNLSRWKENP